MTDPIIVPFMDNLAQHLQPGHHTFTIAGTPTEARAVLIWPYDPDLDDEALTDALAELNTAYEAGRTCVVTLRSHLDTGLPFELRSWLFTPNGVFAITAEQLKRAYNTDAATGEALPPVADELYCDAWPFQI